MLTISQDFKSKSTDNFNLVLLLLTLVVSAFPIAYAIVSVPPPAACAPFRTAATTFDASLI